MGQAGGRAVPSSVTEIVLAGETTAPVLLAMADLMLAGMKGLGGKADSGLAGGCGRQYVGHAEHDHAIL